MRRGNLLYKVQRRKSVRVYNASEVRGRMREEDGVGGGQGPNVNRMTCAIFISGGDFSSTLLQTQLLAGLIFIIPIQCGPNYIYHLSEILNWSWEV